jgi:hypothetical protein
LKFVNVPAQTPGLYDVVSASGTTTTLNQVLRSTATAGLGEWGGLTELDLPSGLGFLGKWVGQVQARGNGTTGNNFGGLTQLTQGTAANDTDATASLFKYTDTIFDWVGVVGNTNPNFRRDHVLRFGCTFKTPDSGTNFTDVRICVGMGDSSAAAQIVYNSYLGNTAGFAIVYDTSIPDTTWQAIACDGSGGTDYAVVNTGVTVTAATLYRVVFVADSTNVKVYLQTGLTGAMSLVATLSSKLPAASTTLVPACVAGDPPFAETGKYIRWARFTVMEG